MTTLEPGGVVQSFAANTSPFDLAFTVDAATTVIPFCMTESNVFVDVDVRDSTPADVFALNFLMGADENTGFENMNGHQGQFRPNWLWIAPVSLPSAGDYTVRRTQGSGNLRGVGVYRADSKGRIAQARNGMHCWPRAALVDGKLAHGYVQPMTQRAMVFYDGNNYDVCTGLTNQDRGDVYHDGVIFLNDTVNSDFAVFRTTHNGDLFMCSATTIAGLAKAGRIVNPASRGTTYASGFVDSVSGGAWVAARSSYGTYGGSQGCRLYNIPDLAAFDSAGTGLGTLRMHNGNSNANRHYNRNCDEGRTDAGDLAIKLAASIRNGSDWHELIVSIIVPSDNGTWSQGAAYALGGTNVQDGSGVNEGATATGVVWASDKLGNLETSGTPGVMIAEKADAADQLYIPGRGVIDIIEWNATNKLAAALFPLVRVDASAGTTRCTLLAAIGKASASTEYIEADDAFGLGNLPSYRIDAEAWAENADDAIVVIGPTLDPDANDASGNAVPEDSSSGFYYKMGGGGGTDGAGKALRAYRVKGWKGVANAAELAAAVTEIQFWTNAVLGGMGLGFVDGTSIYLTAHMPHHVGGSSFVVGLETAASVITGIESVTMLSLGGRASPRGRGRSRTRAGQFTASGGVGAGVR